MGGIAGQSSGAIDNCTVSGTIWTNVSQTQKHFGGICGYTYSSGTIRNCTNFATIKNTTSKSSENSGGIAGYNGGSIKGCFTVGTFNINDGSTNIGVVVGSNYTKGTISGTYYYAGTSSYDAVAENNNTTEGLTFKMTADLDFSAMPNNCHDNLNKGSGNFLPIGIDAKNGDSAFKGHFDGDGHTITGLCFTSSASEIGLFIHIYSTSAVIEGVTLVSPNFSAQAKVGGIVGVLQAGKVRNCAVVNGTLSVSEDKVGGILGFSEYSLSTDVKFINDCTVVGTTVSGPQKVGIIVGGNDPTSDATTALNIRDCTYHNPVGLDICGTFDGNGHTLNVNYGTADDPVAEDNAAPFRNVENGCVIKNLHVAGDIYSSKKYAAGIAGTQYGTVNIENCRVSATIHSYTSGDGTHGGFVGRNGNGSGSSITIDGCVFDGKLLTCGTTATTDCSGFVGYKSNDRTVTITNSLYAPAAIDEGETEIATGATFVRNGSAGTNCYYTRTLGDAQGKQAHSITAGENVTVALSGTATEYNVSGITVYEGNNGVSYSGQLYAGATETVTLNISYTVPDGYVLIGFIDGNGNALTDNGDGSYTLTMTSVAPTVTPDLTDHWDIAMNASGIMTYASKAALDFSQKTSDNGSAELSAYIVSAFDGTAGTLTLSGIDIVPAGTGLLLKGTPSTTFTIPVASNAPAHPRRTTCTA